MDPDVCFREIFDLMNEGEGAYAEAFEKATELLAWLDKGGCYPRGYSYEYVRAYVKGVIRRTCGFARAK